VRSEGSGMRVLGEGEGVVLLAVVLPWSAFVEKGSVSFYCYVLAHPDVSGPLSFKRGLPVGALEPTWCEAAVVERSKQGWYR
jgi:hypothetical protein